MKHKQMKHKLFCLLILPAVLLSTGCQHTNGYNIEDANEHAHSDNAGNRPHTHLLTADDSARFYSPGLTVKGEVRFPLSLTVDSLKKMRTFGLDSFNVVCQSGATMSRSVKTRGVLLKDIIEKASIIQTSHKDRNFYIVARATDGYKATFSWAELFNNATGENTFVIFEENGRPITEKGAMVLNCTNDSKTGVRHVIWLSSIEVNRVE